MNQEPAAYPWAATPSAEERRRIARITRDAWRELAFWYECDFSGRQWRFRADRNGLRAFARAIRDFLAAPVTSELGEHLHLGPYANLRIMRGDQPVISWRGIGGSAADLEALVAELESLAAGTPAATYELCAGFAHDDGFRVVLQIEPDDFDPASADPTVSDAAES